MFKIIFIFNILEFPANVSAQIGNLETKYGWLSRWMDELMVGGTN